MTGFVIFKLGLQKEGCICNQSLYSEHVFRACLCLELIFITSELVAVVPDCMLQWYQIGKLAKICMWCNTNLDRNHLQINLNPTQSNWVRLRVANRVGSIQNNWTDPFTRVQQYCWRHCWRQQPGYFTELTQSSSFLTQSRIAASLQTAVQSPFQVQIELFSRQWIRDNQY